MVDLNRFKQITNLYPSQEMLMDIAPLGVAELILDCDSIRYNTAINATRTSLIEQLRTYDLLFARFPMQKPSKLVTKEEVRAKIVALTKQLADEVQAHRNKIAADALETKKYDFSRFQVFLTAALTLLIFIAGLVVQHYTEKEKIDLLNLRISNLEKQLATPPPAPEPPKKIEPAPIPQQEPEPEEHATED